MTVKVSDKREVFQFLLELSPHSDLEYAKWIYFLLSTEYIWSAKIRGVQKTVFFQYIVQADEDHWVVES